MFGKLMNNFYYGKSGKADFKRSDLPKTRMELFTETLRVRLSALVRLNFIYLLCWIPALIVIVLGVSSTISLLSSSIAEAGEEAIESVATTVSLAGSLRSILTTTLILLIPCIAITGPFTSGVCYVTRNWARDEHAFIWSDFKDAVKENWKQSLVISIVTGLMPMIVYLCWTFYGQMTANTPFMIVPQILVAMIGLIWSLTVTYTYPLIVTYRLKMGEVLRNALLLAIGRLPMSIGIRLLHMVPIALMMIAAQLWNLVIPMLILLAYYIVIGFSLSRFVTASYTNATFDKLINSRIEGVEVGRGMAKPEDLEDDEDEDEETAE